MTTPTDWRALCAELLEALEIQLDELASTNRLCKRARAALAQPEAESSITFNESRDSEVMRVDQRGFHYRGELIEDAGLAHQLMMTFLQRHTSMHPEVTERGVAQPVPEGLTYEELREWYSYCPEDGIELHSSKELAQKAAQEIMESYAKAAYSDGWHEDMESVSWGMILPVEQAQVVERTKADSDSGFDEWVQYALMPRRM